VAYIDRTNVAFASLTMNKGIGLSAKIYGRGAGIFFLGYFFSAARRRRCDRGGTA